MIRQNLHAHCNMDDGKNTIEEMIAAARNAGLTSLGISIHTPAPYSASTCRESDLQAFLDTMNELKQKEYAKDKFELFAGAEWDVLSDMPLYEDEERNGYKVPALSSFDYVIGSVHAIPAKRSAEYNSPFLSDYFKISNDKGYTYHLVDEDIQKIKYAVRDQFSGKDIFEKGDAAAECYFAEYAKVADNPLVSIVGHFDLLKKFCPQYSFYDEDYRVFNENHSRYRLAAEKALDYLLDKQQPENQNLSPLSTRLIERAAELDRKIRDSMLETLKKTHDPEKAAAAVNALTRTDKIFEVNTSRLYVHADTKEPSYTQYPSRQWLEYILENGSRVTVSSDAHCMEDVAKEFRTAEQILWDIGFREVWVLKATEVGNLFFPEPIKNPSIKA